ncbi:MAG: molybdopterin converting factor subunit 1 [Methanobacteriota archaeon]|nr:MAG: molybdopterin converting factor subunit 1 [Euryarchaeota archaeon]
MQVTVKFFATYREISGSKELKVRVPEGSSVQVLLDSIYAKLPRLKGFEDTMLLAVNHEFAEPTATLREGDEVALMPPVSGGAGGVIKIQRTAIDVQAVVDSVRRYDAGAVVLFLGTVRSDPGVAALDYEVYRPMALKKMNEIAERARKKFEILDVSIVHRLGRIKLGGDSVAVAISAPHRREAFAAAAWAMDEMKKVVPIWKAEP